MSGRRFILSAWDWNPWVMAISAGALLIYTGRCQFRSGRKPWWLVSGLAVFLLALSSPVDALADGYLFSAHMLQHLLLLLVAPLLILLSLPATPEPDVVHNGPAGWLGRVLARPLPAWLLGVGGMWLWHAPALCNLAVANVWMHRVQYLTLLVMGFAFWRPIAGPCRQRRLPPLPGMIYLFSACLGCTVLGIIITFSPVQVCSIYLHPVDRMGILPLIRGQWGFTPAKDQQLGGLLMWVPACLIYFGGILGLFARWHGEVREESVVPQSKSLWAEKLHGH